MMEQVSTEEIGWISSVGTERETRREKEGKEEINKENDNRLVVGNSISKAW